MASDTAVPPGSAVTAAVQLTLLLQRFLTPYQEDFEWAHQKWPDMKGAMHDVVIGYARMNVADVIHQHFAAQHAASVAATEARLAASAPEGIKELIRQHGDDCFECGDHRSAPDGDHPVVKIYEEVFEKCEASKVAVLAAFDAVAQQRDEARQSAAFHKARADLNREGMTEAVLQRDALQRRVEELEGKVKDLEFDVLFGEGPDAPR